MIIEGHGARPKRWPRKTEPEVLHIIPKDTLVLIADREDSVDDPEGRSD